MTSDVRKINREFLCENCLTGEIEKITIQNGRIQALEKSESNDRLLFVGPGLIDLQINGVNGIDFNNPLVTAGDIKRATMYLLCRGVTTYFPTVITNSTEAILRILRTIHDACESYAVVRECIGGIHLEGPFISPEDGAKGAHDKKYIQPPDWSLFQKFQEAAGGRIAIITLAPEWAGSTPFIEKCRQRGIIVSIGHSMANSVDVEGAIAAGAVMSTHLGNAVPLMLPRHPNLIWDQLAADELYVTLITDGIHIPDAFIRTVLKAKGDKALIVSDATCFAGMLPGEYETHIGGVVVLDDEKRVALKNSGGLLAGAAKLLAENVELLVSRNIVPLADAWKMASLNVRNLLKRFSHYQDFEKDLVLFDLKKSEMHIRHVIKHGHLICENPAVQEDEN